MTPPLDPEQPTASYEWVTTFVIRHHAGSHEGAIHQRNQWDKLIEADGGELTMADTQPGDASVAGLRAFFAAADEADDTEGNGPLGY
jgi:hypothetical protein